MNTRYILKIVDFVLQVLSVLIPIVWAAATGKGIYFFAAYLSLGGTQFISCLLNRLFLATEFRAGKRCMYELILAGYTLIALFFYFHSVYGWRYVSSEMCYQVRVLQVDFVGVLGFTSPILGIWYGILSFVEIGNVKYNKEG